MKADDDWVQESAPKPKCRICDTPKVVERLKELSDAIEKAKVEGKSHGVSILKLGRKLMKDIPAFRCADSTFRRVYYRHREFCND